MFAALDRLAARLADGLIRVYQRCLSPLKGRDCGCAFRLVHGGPSCSQHVRDLLAVAPLSEVLPRLRPRFEACRVAAGQLGGPAPHRRRHRGACCIVIPLPACSTTRRP